MTKTNSVCHPAPADKRKYVSDLGKILVKDYGKKKYYKPEEVKKAHKKSDWSRHDFSCWAMCTYTSHTDFDAYHRQTGEACDYVSMKAEMLQGISLTETAPLAELPDSDLDASWLDIGGILEKVFGGISDFFSAITEDADTDLDVDVD